MRASRTVALVMVSAGAAWAQGVNSIIRQLGWEGPTWSALVLLILLFVTIVLAFVIIGLRRSYREQATDRRSADQAFAEAAQRCKLGAAEVEALKRLLRHEPSMHPQTIFQSAALFERCVHAEVEQNRQAGSTGREELSRMLAELRRKLGFATLPLEHPLVSTRNIALGQTGSVFGKSHRSALLHRVVVVGNSEFFLRLQYDPRQEEPVRFEPGTVLKFAFARQNDGFYGISLTLADTDNAGTLTFHHTLDLKRNQLRQYVRVEVTAPVRLRLLKTANPEKSEVKRGQAVEAKMADVSGGGISFLHTASLKPGDLISLSFNLPPYSFSGIGGKVLRVSLQEGKTQTLYRHHVEFATVEQKQREQIVKYVFERQRQLNQWR